MVRCAHPGGAPCPHICGHFPRPPKPSTLIFRAVGGPCACSSVSRSIDLNGIMTLLLDRRKQSTMQSRVVRRLVIKLVGADAATAVAATGAGSRRRCRQPQGEGGNKKKKKGLLDRLNGQANCVFFYQSAFNRTALLGTVVGGPDLGRKRAQILSFLHGLIENPGSTAPPTGDASLIRDALQHLVDRDIIVPLQQAAALESLLGEGAAEGVGGGAMLMMESDAPSRCTCRRDGQGAQGQAALAGHPGRGRGGRPAGQGAQCRRQLQWGERERRQLQRGEQEQRQLQRGERERRQLQRGERERRRQLERGGRG